jgi:1-acyl-sn-glycerol-3-phosphate acyltransferase
MRKPENKLVRSVGKFKPLGMPLDEHVLAIGRQFAFDKKNFVGLNRLAKTDIRKVFNQLKLARLMEFNYRKVKINVKGTVPDSKFIIAMNHTDRYSFWPLQYELFKREGKVGSVWVNGGKRNAFVNWFYDTMGLIPVPTPTYMIIKGYEKMYGKSPSRDEVDLFKRGEGEFGIVDVPLIKKYHSKTMGMVNDISMKTLNSGLYLIVFPEGTRGLQLQKGRLGLAQFALSNRIPVVPVGCSGGNRIYPGRSPWAKPGEATYRIGKAIQPYDLRLGFCTKDVGLEKEVTAGTLSGLEKYTAHVMDRINDLVDEEYKRIINPIL